MSSEQPGISHLGAKRAQRTKASVTRIMRGAEFPLRAAATPRGQTPLPVNVGANYDTDWARRFPARVARRVARDTIVRGLVRYYAQPTIKGVDRLSELDGPAAARSTKRSRCCATAGAW